MANRRGGFAKKIRETHWTLASWSVAGLAGTGTAGITLFNAQHLPETLMRMRGRYSCALDGALASPQGAGVAFGIILVPEGTGTSVLWSPISDGDAPWIWWDTALLLYEESVTDVVQSTGQVSSIQAVIDSKAMRINRNQELQFVVENGAALSGYTTAAINTHGQLRILAGS